MSGGQIGGQQFSVKEEAASGQGYVTLLIFPAGSLDHIRRSSRTPFFVLPLLVAGFRNHLKPAKRLKPPENS